MTTLYDINGNPYERGAQSDGTRIGTLGWTGVYQRFNDKGQTLGEQFYKTPQDAAVALSSRRVQDEWNAAHPNGRVVTGPSDQPMTRAQQLANAAPTQARVTAPTTQPMQSNLGFSNPWFQSQGFNPQQAQSFLPYQQAQMYQIPSMPSRAPWWIT